MRRRSLLAGATASIIGGSYLARNIVAPSGRITRRVVSGISTTPDGPRTAEDVLRELIVDTDPIEVIVYIQEPFRDVFTTDSSNTVDSTTHEQLTDRYDDVHYLAEHFRGSGESGETSSTTPLLSRSDFNTAVIATDVRMVYHQDSGATVVSKSPPDETVELRPHPELTGEA